MMASENVSTLEPIDYLYDTLEAWSIRLSPRFVAYRPKQKILLETNNYILKTADTTDELIELFRLRYMNFLASVKGHEETYDLDSFDHICDHLIIKCKSSDEIVGTYRIICSLYSERFYSQGEFELDEFLQKPGVTLELGRACIDQYHRNGAVIDLLWRGIGMYATKTNAKYLFGCSSVKTIDQQTSYNLFHYLSEKGQVDQKFHITPTEGYRFDFDGMDYRPAMEVKDMIPPLLKSYLAAGAKVHGHPALDRDFECIDFLTILNLEKISPLFKRRYFK